MRKKYNIKKESGESYKALRFYCFSGIQKGIHFIVFFRILAYFSTYRVIKQKSPQTA